MTLPPIAIGAALGAAALLVLSPTVSDALETLRAARTAHTRLAAEAQRPDVVTPIVAPAAAIPAADEAAARAAVLTRVNRLSKAGGILVETVGAVPMPHGVAAVRLRASGAEKAVLAFADALERERPLMRLRSWRVEPAAGGGVRLSGEVVAPWQ
ncbi:hypothetical protein [Sphingomonas xinjiangensis]|uniref:Type II secretion system (T2SS), protein M subtype b n=1 Tax=Sphingomonas xinjiangensis TaxID=643568 RepID=A0A840YMD1_9SPHN|nr:hypothetical protein [Sphingomonas xinjiangensis]MBB5710720.1 hypothetical protein [Sphingomonas xinjiangensis]